MQTAVSLSTYHPPISAVMTERTFLRFSALVQAMLGIKMPENKKIMLQAEKEISTARQGTEQG